MTCRWAPMVLLLASACTVMSDIAPADARRLVQHGARLLDVRSAEEYAAGHLPGAVNISVQELSGRLGELGSKEIPIIVYCHTGVRAAFAESILSDAGFRRVRNLGGFDRWPAEDEPLLLTPTPTDPQKQSPETVRLHP